MTFTWGQGHTKCCPVPSTSRHLCTCKVWRCFVQRLRRRCIYKKKTLYDLDLGVKVTDNVAQYSPHHVIYAPAKLEVAKSNRLGEEAFKRKYIIWPWPQGSRSHKASPSTSCDICIYKVCSCHIQQLRRRYIYKKCIRWPWPPRSRSYEVLPNTLYIMWPMHLQSLKLLCSTV